MHSGLRQEYVPVRENAFLIYFLEKQGTGDRIYLVLVMIVYEVLQSASKRDPGGELTSQKGIVRPFARIILHAHKNIICQVSLTHAVEFMNECSVNTL